MSKRAGESFEYYLVSLNDYLDSAHKHNCGTVVERYLNDEHRQKRMHDQTYTQTGVEEFDKIALKRKTRVATPAERRCYRNQRTVVQPNQGGGSNTVKSKEHPEHKQLAQ